MPSINAISYNPNGGHMNQVQAFELMNTTSSSNRQLNDALHRRPFQPINFNYGNASVDRQHLPSTSHAVIQEPGPSNFVTNTLSNNQESDNKPNSAIKTNVDTTALLKKGNENIRIFTGTPEKIVKWHRLYRNYFCFYEVISAIVSIQEGTVRLQKVMLLRDKKGPILQVVHYVNDHIDIENFFVGQILRCVGRMVGPSVMHGLSIRQAKPDEIGSLQRMCFISDHAISKLKKN
ncbi:hypothetical protein PPYR_12552 [Photinus pyralis]|nr:hypothetical protein PPYR_12552 [Photinus pyralis]